ncbi:MAG: DMT family transporter [Arenicella sp.]|nr:DMT family transporter [Arenicella sp.]
MKAESKGLTLGFIAVFMFGLTLPVTRFISPYFEPVFIGLGRAALACVFATLFLLAFKAALPSYSQVKRLLVVALGVVIGFPVLSAWAMQSLPASHGGVVLGILPLATAAASRVVSDERPSLGFWLVGVAGSILVIAYSLLQGGGAFLLGDLALFAAIVSAAFGYAVGGKLSKEIGGWQVICWALVLVFPVIIGPTLYYAPNDLQTLSTPVILGFLYLTLISQLFGFFIWYKAMAIGGVARVSQIQLIQPFVTLLASAWALSEIIEVQSYIFATIVVGVVAVGKQMPIYSKHHFI